MNTSEQTRRNRRHAPVAFLAAFILLSLLGYRWLRPPFQTDAWISAQTDGRLEVRNRMAHDLLRRHLRQGMTQNQVIGLLGQPTEKEAKGDWIYMMDFPRFSLELDPEYLRITFDESDRLADAKIMWG